MDAEEPSGFEDADADNIDNDIFGDEDITVEFDILVDEIAGEKESEKAGFIVSARHNIDKDPGE